LRERFALRRQRIADDLAALGQLVARRGAGKAPDALDLPGITWLLGAIYCEIEEVLKGIAAHFGEQLPAASNWHRDLLDSMTRPSARRTAVLSATCVSSLDAYRAFRHYSRNATFPALEWERMRPLVETVAEAVGRFDAEAAVFLQQLPD
jgi:hypothetical protein